MDWFDNPIDTRITTYRFVLGVDKNDLKVFVRRVLIDPVRIEDAQIGAAASNAFFSRRFQGALIFELVDALVGRFT